MIAFSPFVDGAATWIATFVLHSTLALGLAWLVTAAMQKRAQPLQEALLRWSLWAALLSTTLQVAVVGSPWLPFASWEGVASELSLDVAAPISSLPHLESSSTFAAAPELRSDALSAPVAASIWTWRSVLVVAAAFAAGIGLSWLLLVQHRLQRLLADRRPETDSRVLATAARAARVLGLRQSPHLSRSRRIGTPIAFGWLRPEICLPERVGDLGDASLRAMLAHEIAHLRRADPAWMWAAAWLQAMFPWQPLFLVVRRRWAHLIELRCDAVAAHHAGSTAVARCLLDVAEWLRPHLPQPLGALGMASRPSALRERVEAALQGRRVREPNARWLQLAGGLAVSLLTLAAPGLATAPAAEEGGALAAVAPTQPADAIEPPASPGVPSPLAALLAELMHEQRQLVAEANTLRADLQGQPVSPELTDLHALLARKLAVLETTQQRLQGLLARRSPESR